MANPSSLHDPLGLAPPDNQLPQYDEAEGYRVLQIGTGTRTTKPSILVSDDCMDGVYYLDADADATLEKEADIPYDKLEFIVSLKHYVGAWTVISDKHRKKQCCEDRGVRCWGALIWNQKHEGKGKKSPTTKVKVWQADDYPIINGGYSHTQNRFMDFPGVWATLDLPIGARSI
jgi:hypothetical protein